MSFIATCAGRNYNYSLRYMYVPVLNVLQFCVQVYIGQVGRRPTRNITDGIAVMTLTSLFNLVCHPPRKTPQKQKVCVACLEDFTSDLHLRIAFCVENSLVV